MLAVQNISLKWGKEERGLDCARIRAGFPMAYPVEARAPEGEAAVENLVFWQKGTEFIDCIQRAHSARRWQCYSCLKEMNLTNMRIISKGGGSPLEVAFFYDEHRSGKPFRRGHNRDYDDIQSPFYRKDCLNETAFILEEGQYGRILWNERRTDFDTGEWYYQLHIVNLCHMLKKEIESDIFMAFPDVTYRQMADLK